MTQLTFPPGATTEMLFKLGVAGTQTKPSRVMVMLERSGVSMGYEAQDKGGEWCARIDSPDRAFGSGEVNLRVDVYLNNRIFTPFKSVAMIEGEAEAPAVVQLPDSQSPSAQAEPPVPELPPVPANPSPGPTIDLPVTVTAEETVEPAPPLVPATPVKTQEERMQEAKNMLDKARANISKKKKGANIEVGILKAIEPAKERKPVAEAAKGAPVKAPDLFKLKRVRTVVK